MPSRTVAATLALCLVFASASVAAEDTGIPRYYRGKKRTEFMLANWRELSGAALGEFGYRLMTPRTLDPATKAPALPIALVRALPTLLPERFPEPGFRNYGLLADPDDPDGLPVGLKTGGVSPRRVAFSCAACHSSLVRGRIAHGAPNSNLRVGDLLLDLADAARDPAVSFDGVRAAAEKAGGPLPADDLADLKTWLEARPNHAWSEEARARIAGWGPGRLDVLGGSGYPTRIPPLYGLMAPFHTDGTAGNLLERNKYSLWRRGADRAALETPEATRVFEALSAYLTGLRPPTPPKVDADLAMQGSKVFGKSCASCHVAQASKTMPIEFVGTDDRRSRQASPLMLLGLSWEFKDVQVNWWPMIKIPPLIAVASRRQFLHNGSVPSLAVLLSPPWQRPPVFVHAGVVVDTKVPGNSNRGHDFGTDLEPDEKSALLAYLRSI